MRSRIVLLVSLLHSGAAVAVPLRGVVVDKAGRPPEHVVLRVEPLSERALRYIDVDKPIAPLPEHVELRGASEFEIDVPAPGAHRVWFHAPHHRGYSVVIFAAAGERVLPKVTVALARERPVEWFGAPAVYFKGAKGEPIEMRKEEDGTWSLAHPATEPGELKYFIVLKKKEGREWFPNPGAPTVFDRQLYSVAKPTEGVVRIRFDPRALEGDWRKEPEVTFDDPRSPVARMALLARRFEDHQASSHRATRDLPREESGRKWAELLRTGAPEFVAAFRDKRAPRRVRELAAVLVANPLFQPDQKLQVEAAAFVPPDSWAWAALPPAHDGAPTLKLGEGDRTWRYLEQVAKRHPDPGVRGGALYALARRAEEKGDPRAKRLHKEVLVKYSEVDPVRWGLMRAQRKRTRVAGSEFPDLKMTTIDGKPLDRKSLEGRYTLIDFSAYGCGACVTLIPDLQAVRRAYPEEALRMVTITHGLDERGLKGVLARQPPQPWEHVADPDSDERYDQYQAWEVTYWPTLFLVGPDGRIVAVDEDLRRGALPANLAKFYPPPPAAAPAP